MNQPLAVGTVLNNKYRIVRQVGGGGMAWVYQVEELPPGSGKLWAVKELRPQTQNKAEQATSRKLFEQEAALLHGLDHPSIPKIVEQFPVNGRSCLVMEFVWGVSLEKRLEQANAPLLEADVLNWAVQLCDALHYLHTRQPPVIFRDLKPSNVMLTNAGQIKLIDFGIARTYKENKKRDTVAMGSENYAAPEQWGSGQTDARSDVYALGATLYHLLANMAPTPAFLPSEPLPLANYNPALSKRTIALVEKAMNRDAGRRFQSAMEMRQAILAALPSPYVAPAPQPVQAVAGPAPRPIPAAQPVPGGPAPSAASRTPQPVGPAPAQGLQAAPARQAAGPALRPAPAAPPRPQAVPAVVRVCPACGAANAERARFCGRCGRPLVSLPPAILRVVEPVRAAWEMPVARSPMLLGRASPAEDYRPAFDMAFYDEGGYVSRRHAQITRGRAGYFITDLGSSNGTTQNGQPLVPHRAYELHNGDRIKVGLVVVEFRLKGGAQ